MSVKKISVCEYSSIRTFNSLAEKKFESMDERNGVLTVQNAYLSYYLVRRNLVRAKVHVNGFLRHNADTSSHPSLEGDRFKRAVRALETANDSFMDRHRESVLTLVKNLDISDSQLHTEFLKSAGQVVDEIRWGRIASLFFLTSLLAERLVNEGQGAKIEGLTMWLAQFLNDHVSHWIEARGGWVSSYNFQHMCILWLARCSEVGKLCALF